MRRTAAIFYIFAAALVALVALAATAAHAAPARTFDILGYTPPRGWKVEAKPGQPVTISKISGSSYCLVGLYASTPASGDLAASFAAEWKTVVLHTVDAVEAPEPTMADLGNTRAAMGGAATTVGGKPVAAVLIVLDAGSSVMSILILTPSTDAFEAYTADVQGMLAGLSVRRQESSGGAAAPSAAPPEDGGKLVIPPLSRSLTVADLAGEWGHQDGFTTTYVDRHTGAYAGYDSLHFRTKYTISPKGAVVEDFFAIRNGKKVVDKQHGTIAISGRILQVRLGSNPLYVVRGWLDGPELTVLLICGPFYDTVPQDVLDDPEKGTNLNKYWVRRARGSKPK